MTMKTLTRQIGRPGPVFCHYRTHQREFGYRFSRSVQGVLLSFGWRGHAFGIGWMVR